MTDKKSSPLISLSICIALIAGIVGFIYIRQTYNQAKVEAVEIAWKGTAFDWSEKAIKNEAFVSTLENKYLELEGVLLNVVVTQGQTILYFTSGQQTDSAYLVGQQPEWQAIEKQPTRSSCDTLVVMYGRNYNFQPAPVLVNFFGDVVNSDDDKLLHFAFFEDCRFMQNKTNKYRLHNFCANKVKVRAKLSHVEKQEGILKVELDEVLIVSNEKNKIKMQ